MFSIYGMMFNVEKMKFDWRDAIENWDQFLQTNGEIVIAVNKSEDKSLELIKDFTSKIKFKNPYSDTRFKILDVDIPYSDPEFDGKCKDAALKQCTNEYCILLDCDERIVQDNTEAWSYYRNKLAMNENIDAYLIPSIDLHKDYKNYSKIGFKFYLHRNKPNIGRGVVKWAYREDGSIDIKKSDTTELKYRDSGELVKCQYTIMPELPDFIKVGQLQSGNSPFVYHLSTLDIEQRMRQNAFWEPVWQNRDKSEVKTQKTIEELKKMSYFSHNLPPLLKK